MTDQPICFFCEARPARPESVTTVHAQRRTAQSDGELVESRSVDVERCSVCEQTELLRWVITGGILAVLLVVVLITWRMPRMVFGVSVSAVIIGGLALYSAWRNARGVKRSMADVREYPEVTELIRDGYRVARSGPWEVFSRLFERR